MANYIDRDKLLRDIEKYHVDKTGKFQHWVEIQHVADVAPVVHGRWEHPRWAMKYPRGMCSECGWVNSTGAHRAGFRLRFCPACGAKMVNEGLNNETD